MKNNWSYYSILNKTDEMKARGAAIDQLVDEGTLEDPTGEKKDDIERELAKISNKNTVDAELAKLKAEMGKSELIWF